MDACFFFFNDTATTEIYTLSLHDALPILTRLAVKLDFMCGLLTKGVAATGTEVYRGVQTSVGRSEEHTSELQSPCNLVCRLLLEKKKKKQLAIGASASTLTCGLCVACGRT